MLTAIAAIVYSIYSLIVVALSTVAVLMSYLFMTIPGLIVVTIAIIYFVYTHYKKN